MPYIRKFNNKEIIEKSKKTLLNFKFVYSENEIIGFILKKKKKDNKKTYKKKSSKKKTQKNDNHKKK